MNGMKALLPVYTTAYAIRMCRYSAFSAAQCRKIQNDRLKRLLIHAHANHEFYRARFDACGLDPERFDGPEQLSRLPVLTKEEYRAWVEGEVRGNPLKYSGWHRGTTSGSSGTPMNIVRTWKERAWMNAKWLSILFLNGYRFTDRYFRLTSHDRHLNRSPVLQRLGLVRSHFVSCVTAPGEMYRAYQRVRPDVLAGTRSSLLQLVAHARRNALPLHKPKICGVGGEVVDEVSRTALGSAFGSDRLIEIYGCEELGAMAFQSRGGQGLSWSHAMAMLELCNGSEGGPSEAGDVVVTDLNIRSFPLIRYRLGDRMETLRDGETGLRHVKRICGRSNDWLVWKDNSRTDWNVFYQVMNRFSGEISQYRVVQETVDHVQIRVVLEAGNTGEEAKASVESRIIPELKLKLPADVRCEIKYVECIPLEPSGKSRTIVSNVPQQCA